MFDLGTSFVASVARDPHTVAIVDDGVRLTYAQWYARISSLVASFDRIGLKPDKVIRRGLGRPHPGRRIDQHAGAGGTVARQPTERPQALELYNPVL